MQMHTNNANEYLHRRQFLIGSSPSLVKSTWEKKDLTNGMILSHCPELEVESAQDLDGGMWYILGNAFQADPSLPDPLKHVSSLRGGQIPGATYTWAGRWALIGPQVIVPDAAGLLGLFYLNRPSQTLVVSSSLAILKDLVPDLQTSKRRLGWYGMGWVPPPSTKLSSVMKLLPDQTLSIDTGSISYLKRTFPERYANMSTDERAKLLLSYLKSIFRQLAAKRKKICLTLTSGIDSRSALAVALTVGRDIEAVTMDHPRISMADRFAPPNICTAIRIKHSYLRPGKFDRTKQRVYDAHTLFNVNDADRYFFSFGVFERLPKDAWLVRSGCWEVGTSLSTIKRAIRGITWQEARENPEKIVWRFGNFGNVKILTDQLREWMNWREAHPEPFNWRDLFYRDQRAGGWLSAIEQSLDMLDGRSIQPANCSTIYDILSSEGADWGDDSLQRRLMELSGTGLDSFPINPPLETKHQRIARGVKRRMRRLIGETRNMIFG